MIDGELVLVAMGSLALVGGVLALLKLGLGAGSTVAAGAGFVALPLLGSLALVAVLATVSWNVWGDPHLVTLDGLAYDLQAVGEFHLLQVPEHGIDIQGRFSAPGADSSFSVSDSIAFKMNGFTVEFGMDNRVSIDGAETSVPNGGGLYLNAGAMILRADRRLVAIWPGMHERPYIVWDRGSFAAEIPDGTATAGLLGDNDGDPLNDLVLRDGTALPADASPEVLHGPFANSWRISDEDSHFAYGPGESTATYTDLSFPSQHLTLADFSDAELGAARRICSENEVEPGFAFDSCMFDIIASGDQAYVDAAAAVVRPVIDPHASHVDENGALFEDFEGSVPVNFDGQRFMEDPATSRVAGPLFDRSGYNFSVGDLPRHDAVHLTMDLIAYGETDADQQVRIRPNQGETLTVTVDDEPQLDPSGVGSVVLVSEGTTADGDAFSVYRVELTVEHSLASLGVSIEPVGFTGILGTALAIDNIGLEIQSPAADVFPIAVPQEIAPDRPAPGAGRLETGGSQDEYEFVVDGDDTSLFVRLPSCPKVSVVLRDVGTGNTIESADHSCIHARFHGVDAGTYRLAITTDTGDALDYRFSISVIVDGAGGILEVDGWPVESVLDAGQNRTLRFELDEGDRVRLSVPDLTFSFFSLRLSILAPDGTVLVNRAQPGIGSSWLVEADQAGVYEVVLDPTGSASGSVLVQATSVPDLPDAVLEVDGGPLESEFAAGQNRTLRFEADAGQRLRLSVPASTFGNFALRLTVTAPDGTRLLDGQTARPNDEWLLETTQEGTYEVFLDPRDVAGSASVQLESITSQPDGVQVASLPDGLARTSTAGWLTSPWLEPDPHGELVTDPVG